MADDVMAEFSDSSEITSLSAQIANFVSSADINNVPEDSKTAARHAILDWFGVTLAGYDQPLSKILRDTYASGGDCAIVGGRSTASVKDAALINGATSHALDYDDVNVMGHPTAPIFPAVLAVGQANGSSFEDILISFIAGFEAGAVIAMKAMPSHYVKGFHTTGTIGSIAAAAAVSRLLKQDALTTAHAIGLAATQASGLKCMFGTMTKPFHAGKAAMNGVIAGQLAAAGFEARPDALESHQGFFFTQSDGPAEPEENYSFGQYIRDDLFKYHAACYLTHSSIEAAEMLHAQHKFNTDEIAHIDVHVADAHLNVCNIQAPTSGLEIKFSLRHCIALKLAGRDTGSIDTYSDEAANDPDLIAIQQKVKVHGGEPGTTAARVEINLSNGEKLVQSTDVGIPAKSLDKQGEKLRAKFISLNDAALNQRAGEFADRIRNIGNQDTIADVVSDIAAARGA